MIKSGIKLLSEALRFFNIKRKGIKIAPGGTEIIFGIFSNTVKTEEQFPQTL